VPLLPFSKQRFDPHFPLVERLVVSKCLLIRFHSIQIVGKKGTVNVPTTLVGGTSGFQRAHVAGSGNRTVFHNVGPALLDEKESAIVLEDRYSGHG
jgi:hypothetical protein